MSSENSHAGHPFHPLMSLVSLVILFSLLALGVLYALGKMDHIDYLDKASMEHASIRTIQVELLVQHIMLFIIPGALTIFIFPLLRPKGTFSLGQVDWERVGLVSLLFVVGLPIVGILSWVNMQIPLSGNMEAMESQVNEAIKTLLGSGNIPMVVFIMGLIPAIGEELVFRGVIQKSLENWTNRPHLSILLAGAIFSLIHFQFAGFLPRMFLGMLLGYAYYYSGSILVPMVLHFLFNATQAVAMVVYPEMLDELGKTGDVEMPSWWAGLLAILAFGYIFSLLLKRESP